jgi:UDP-GlcNAc:undecaprenyl-phosphate/decaprenyl-phosphate GlcNAc-1-phosphate transferase
MPSKSSDMKLKEVFFLYKTTSGYLPFFAYIIPLVGFIFLLKYYIRTRYHHFVPYFYEYFLPALFAFVLVLIIIPLCIKISRHFNIQDSSGGAKNHLVPIPLLGGIGIFAAFLTVALFYQPWTSQMTAIIIASSIIVVMGTIDDIWPLSSITRLLGQLLAAGIVMSVGVKVSFLPHTWWGDALSVLLTSIWILGIVNATNFADGADGLATGFTVIASIFFFLISLHLDQFSILLISSLLVGAGLGFLVFNFKPAKIYLGDGGSTFLGFMLACLSLYGGWSKWNPMIAAGIPIMILSVLIFDMIYITVSRIKNNHVHNFKEWLDYRGNDHFHHRLIHLGFKEDAAVVFIYSTSIMMGLNALVIEHSRTSFPVVVLVIQAIMIFINITILMLIGRRKYPNDLKKSVK